MANNLGKTLSRLIKERAYLAGSLQTKQKEADAIQSRLNSKFTEMSKDVVRLAELDTKITELSAIDPTDIRAIKATPRQMDGTHGSFRRELVRVLQSCDGPVSSGELMRHMAEAFALPLNTRKQRIAANDAVRGPLNIFKKHGAVIRIPSLDGSRQARWQWVKGTEDDQA